MYYLQSRYYDPKVCRFINADEFASTGQGVLGYNMFAYCLNNPVIGCDPSGTIAITTIILISSIVIGVCAGGYTGYSMRKNGSDWGDTIFHSLGTGICAFGTIYTLGMSAYGLYEYYSSIYKPYPYTYGGQVSSKASDSSPTGYVPPKGGGGVSSTVRSGNVNVTFGHGGRHLEGTGMSSKKIEVAIANDIVKRGLTSDARFSTFTVDVGGQTIKYSAYMRSDSVINVGTYYITNPRS